MNSTSVYVAPRSQNGQRSIDNVIRYEQSSESAMMGSKFALAIASHAIHDENALKRLNLKNKKTIPPFKTVFFSESRHNPPLANTHICYEYDAHIKSAEKYWKRTGSKFTHDVRLTKHIHDAAFMGPLKPVEFPQCMESPSKVFERGGVLRPFSRSHEYTKPIERTVPWKANGITPGPDKYNLPDLWKNSSGHDNDIRPLSPVFRSKAKRLNWLYHPINPPSEIDKKKVEFLLEMEHNEDQYEELESPKSASGRPILKSVLDAKFPDIPSSSFFSSNQGSASPKNKGQLKSDLTKKDSPTLKSAPIHSSQIVLDVYSQSQNLEEISNVNLNSYSQTSSQELKEGRAASEGYRSRNTSSGFTFPKSPLLDSAFQDNTNHENFKRYQRVRLPDGSSCILTIEEDPSGAQKSVLHPLPTGLIVTDSWAQTQHYAEKDKELSLKAQRVEIHTPEFLANTKIHVNPSSPSLEQKINSDVSRENNIHPTATKYHRADHDDEKSVAYSDSEYSYASNEEMQFNNDKNYNQSKNINKKNSKGSKSVSEKKVSIQNQPMHRTNSAIQPMHTGNSIKNNNYFEIMQTQKFDGMNDKILQNQEFMPTESSPPLVPIEYKLSPNIYVRPTNDVKIANILHSTLSHIMFDGKNEWADQNLSSKQSHYSKQQHHIASLSPKQNLKQMNTFPSKTNTNNSTLEAKYRKLLSVKHKVYNDIKSNEDQKYSAAPSLLSHPNLSNKNQSRDSSLYITDDALGIKSKYILNGTDLQLATKKSEEVLKFTGSGSFSRGVNSTIIFGDESNRTQRKKSVGTINSNNLVTRKSFTNEHEEPVQKELQRSTSGLSNNSKTQRPVNFAFA